MIDIKDYVERIIGDVKKLIINSRIYAKLIWNILLEYDDYDDAFETQQDTEAIPPEWLIEVDPLVESQGILMNVIPPEECQWMEDISKNLSIPLDLRPDIK